MTMARIVERIDAMTEKKPFTAQAHATYSRGLLGRDSRRCESPSGMNVPRQRPTGAMSSTVSAMRTRERAPDEVDRRATGSAH